MRDDKQIYYIEIEMIFGWIILKFKTNFFKAIVVNKKELRYER
jgi:hypothetical protein